MGPNGTAEAPGTKRPLEAAPLAQSSAAGYDLGLMASFEGMASGPASFPVEGDRQSSEGAVDEAASAEIRLRWEATWPTPSKRDDVIQHGQLLKRRERGYFKNGFISRYWVLRKVGCRTAALH